MRIKYLRTKHLKGNINMKLSFFKTSCTFQIKLNDPEHIYYNFFLHININIYIDAENCNKKNYFYTFRKSLN